MSRGTIPILQWCHSNDVAQTRRESDRCNYSWGSCTARRTGVLAGNAWTKEKSKTLCRLVVPNVQSTEARIPETMCHVPKGEKQNKSQEGSKIPKNPFMLVANKKDRKRVANYLNCNLEGGDPSTCICNVEIIKRHGFNYIITIGESLAGVLFLDCYGRVFKCGTQF